MNDVIYIMTNGHSTYHGIAKIDGNEYKNVLVALIKQYSDCDSWDEFVICTVKNIMSDSFYKDGTYERGIYPFWEEATITIYEPVSSSGDVYINVDKISTQEMEQFSKTFRKDCIEKIKEFVLAKKRKQLEELKKELGE